MIHGNRSLVVYYYVFLLVFEVFSIDLASLVVYYHLRWRVERASNQYPNKKVSFVSCVLMLHLEMR